MSIDNNRSTQGVVLPGDVSQDIWQNIQRESVIQKLGVRTVVPGVGTTIPIIEGTPEAEWVQETDEKPVRRSLLSSKAFKPYTLAVIEPFSNQFVRDLPALFDAMRTRLPKALARKFDRTALGFVASPGVGFDTLNDLATVDISTNPYDGLLSALRTVVGSDEDESADITAWALTPLGEVALLGERDNDGHPLLTSGAAEGGSIGQLLGRPVYKTSHVGNSATHAVGVAGDWSSVVWGYSQAITVSISEEATLVDEDGKVINLWQRNMIGVRAECEIGFVARDHGRFVRLTHTGAAPSGG
ncbi:hypothetical protein BHQ19_19800 [Mycolicibacterium porcinum]|nr:hypothetical protein BHQ19_19800 [Mycolicibacterium porcinum]